MSCRSRNYSSAITTIMRLRTGLTDSQVLSTYHELRRTYTGSSTAPVSSRQWAGELERFRQVAAESGLSEARLRSVNERLDAALNETPDGSSWFAVQWIQNTTQRYDHNIKQVLADYAAAKGVTAEEAADTYHSYLAQVPRGRGVTPDGYENLQQNSQYPPEPATQYVIHRMLNETHAARGRMNADGTPFSGIVGDSAGETRHARRVVIEPIGDSGIYGGYDPADGRLELSFPHNDGTMTRPFGYRGVPPEVWEEISTSDDPAGVYRARIRNVAGYRYANLAEDDVAAGPLRCGNCGRFTDGAGHVCPSAADAASPSAFDDALRPNTVSRGVPEDVWDIEDDPLLDDEYGFGFEDEFNDEDDVDAMLDAIDAEVGPLDDDMEPTPRPESNGEPVHSYTLGLREVSSAREAGPLASVMGQGRMFMAHPSLPELHAAARNQPVIFRFEGSGRFEGDERRWQSAIGEGIVRWDEEEEKFTFEVTEQVACTCDEEQPCMHARTTLSKMTSRVTGETPELTPDQVSAVAAKVNEIRESNWADDEEAVEAVRVRRAESEDGSSYSDDFDSFEEDYQEAVSRHRNGEPVFEYKTENVLGGGFTRESGRGFGVEIEFVFPDSETDVDSALSIIAEDLYDAGLTRSTYQEDYHASKSAGYNDQHQGGWSFESDCTVAGEIVSPIMYDEKETWDNLALVCEIVKRQGGTVNFSAGSHVHVGSPETSIGTVKELLGMSKQYEDVLYRVSSRPGHQHRSLGYCHTADPDEDIHYENVSDLAYDQSREQNINVTEARGTGKDHVEFRMWDGTLDPAVMQQQIKMSCAMMDAAIRNQSASSVKKGSQTVGDRSFMAAAADHTGESETFEEETSAFRSFVDTLYGSKADKKDAAALFAVTEWMHPEG